MKLESKIRSIFSNDLLDLIASICDTKRVDSLQMKMKILRDLLYTYNIKFDILGGATNRIALFIDGYAIKFAMDHQGYRDNLIEYSICEELQPYVTKAYETNGYILVAECVRLMSETDFIARKQDMLNILLSLSDDYLLGDVGYVKKNLTNWGIRDNGELVILDYAYCHRATEKLFTCPVCGEGVLTYDHVFDKLICTNKSVCHATFTYNQRKSEQGDQVDLDMIEERKASSLILQEDETYVDVGESAKGRFVNKNGRKIIIVDNDTAYQEMMEEKKMISKQFNSEEAMDLLVKLAVASSTADDVTKSAVIQDLDDLVVSDDDIEYEIDADYRSMLIGRGVDNEEEPLIPGPYANNNEDDSEEDVDTSLGDLLEIAMGQSGSYNDPEDNDDEHPDELIVPPASPEVKEILDGLQDTTDSLEDDKGTQSIDETSTLSEVLEEAGISLIELGEAIAIQNDNNVGDEKSTEENSDNNCELGIILDGKEL